MNIEIKKAKENILYFKEILVSLSNYERFYIKNDIDLLVHLFNTGFYFNQPDKFWIPKDKDLFIIADMKTRILTLSYKEPKHTPNLFINKL